MPTTHHPRSAPCTGCGDVVLVVERSPGLILGLRSNRKSTIRLEHADPAPDGELFDAVDDGCRRARVGP
ncbi:hypothetical protein [uncultured Jatrophihabitans sp.]|uniref:hypothetical protein n=1 Tax=uncultured Jatrophihabitans sp. TaxID=1610747 RepID=UPI0035CB0F5C